MKSPLFAIDVMLWTMQAAWWLGATHGEVMWRLLPDWAKVAAHMLTGA